MDISLIRQAIRRVKEFFGDTKMFLATYHCGSQIFRTGFVAG